MLIYLLFTFLIAQNDYTTEQFDPKNYFCKSNTEMKILKISEDELVFYGTEGGILRTYDAGKTWHQNYSGLNDSDNVIKLIYSNNEIVGVTNTGKVIISKDKGDYWKINHISADFSGLAEIEGNFFASIGSDSIYTSTDNGLNWIGHKMQFNQILNIKSQKGKLIVTTIGQIYILNKDLTELKSISPPFYKRIYDKFDNLYFSDEFAIFRVNENFEIEKYHIFNEPRVFSIYPIKDAINIFSSTIDSIGMSFYQQSTFDFKTKTSTAISEYKSLNLLHGNNDLLEFKILDVEKTGNDYLLSSYFKTILKVKENTKWEIISYSTRESHIENIHSLDEFPAAVSFRSYLLNTYDRGNTFKLSASPTYTREIFERVDTITPVIFTSYYLNPNRSFIFFGNSGIVNFKTTTSNYKFIGVTNDNFKTIELADINLNAPFQSIITKFSFLGEHNGELYMKRSSESHGSKKIYHTKLYKLNIEFLQLDTIYTFIDSLESINIYFDDNKIWVTGCNEISNNNIKLYLSEDNGKSFELKQTFELIKKHPLFVPYKSYTIRNRDNDLIVYSDYQIMKIDENDFSYSTTTFNLKLSPINYYSLSGNYLEDNIFSWVKTLDGVFQDTIYYSKISINDDELELNNLLYQFNGRGLNPFTPNFITNNKDIIFSKGKNS